MPLVEPKFDSRTYKELVNEALARIPAHNPEWTNRNDTDPGVTLLQLFAFMTESIIYRANLIPERNRQKFLRLLRIPMREAAAARGMVTIHNPRGKLEVVTLIEDKEVFAGNVPFRTERGLDVLPVEARLYYKKPIPDSQKTEIEDIYKKLYASIDDPQTELDFYETTVYEPSSTGAELGYLDLSKQTKDGSLWVALLCRPGETPAQAITTIANKTLSLGILPALDDSGCTLYPLGPSDADKKSSLLFEIPNASTDNVRYEPAKTIINENPLVEPTVVKIQLPSEADFNNKLVPWPQTPQEAGVGEQPPSLLETDDLDRLVTWIRIRSPDIDTDVKASSRQLSINLNWVGINATPVIQKSWVRAEQLPNGTGEPDQVARLINTPVIMNSLELTVNGEVWQEIDNLSAAEGEIVVGSARFAAKTQTQPEQTNLHSRVYTLDRESGEIRFGDGIHGMRPPNKSVIQASYAYGGGRQGMVGVGSINKAPTLGQGLKVNNPAPTWGGSEAETVSDAEKRIPDTIRHRDRLIAEQDFKEITWQTPGVDMGRVEVLALFHPKLKRQTSEGVVTVMVVPLTDPAHPNAPVPDQLFLKAVCAHLSPRRVLTTELHVRGPVYIPVWISIGINIVPGYDPGPVREAVKAEIQKFLSPLTGGYREQGWPLRKVVDALEISAAVTRVEGVSRVNLLRLGQTGAEVSEILIEGLELPQLMKVVVVEGDPPTLDEIRGEVGGEEPDTVRVVPVPVIPTQC